MAGALPGWDSGGLVKRAILLGITTVMWVVALQVITGVMRPTREIALTPNDLAPLVPASQNPDAIVNFDGVGLAFDSPLPGSLGGLFDSSPDTTFSVSAIPVPSITTSTTLIVTTTAAPPTTSAPPSTTTTAKPATTTTTTPPTTTTVAPAPTAPPTTAVPGPTGSFSSGAEADFLGRINGLRGSVGVAALTSNAELDNYARWWARYMADTNNFAHSNIGSLLDPWTIVGENIAAGGSVGAMFDGLKSSSGHYNNMVETRFTAVGIGVWVDATGRLWTAHVFGG